MSAAPVGDSSSSCRKAAEANGCRVAAAVVDKAAVEAESKAAAGRIAEVAVDPGRIVVAVPELGLQAVV